MEHVYIYVMLLGSAAFGKELVSKNSVWIQVVELLFQAAGTGRRIFAHAYQRGRSFSVIMVLRRKETQRLSCRDGVVGWSLDQ